MSHAPRLRRLLGYALLDKPLLIQAIVLLLIAVAADVMGPILIKIFIDDYVRLDQWPVAPLLSLAMVYLILLLVTAVTLYLQAVRFNIIAVNAIQRLREQAFNNVMAMPLSFFDHTPVGSLISRITNDTENIKDLFVNVLSVYIQNIALIFGILIAMAILDWRLMLICFGFVPIVVLFMLLYRRLSTPRFEKVRGLLSDINSQLHESLQGIRVVQFFNQQRRFEHRFGDTTQAHFRAKIHNLKLDAMLLRPLVDLLHLLILAGLLSFFGYSAMSHPIEIGVMYVFINYLGRIVEPVIEMTQRLSLLQQALVSGERVFELIDQANPALPEQVDLRIEQASIEFKQVSFSYDGKQNVLNNISFMVPAGQFCAIVGHTGSGKSTIANLLMRFYTPQQGEILLGGQPLQSIPGKLLRECVGCVQQDPFIFVGSIADNIRMGRDISHEQLQQAAEKSGFDDYVQALPEGYDTEIVERGANLSTGQRQLLSLARSLVVDPQVLILDEATANIDSHTEALIQNTLDGLRGRVTLLVIAHRLSTIQSADNIIVLHKGHIMQQGKHSELLKTEGLYQHLYQLQKLSKSH